MKRHLFYVLYFVIVLNCSNDETVEKELAQVASCNLIEMNCNVPFEENSIYPILPNTEKITVANTSLQAIQNALIQINDTRRALFFPSGIYKLPVFRNTSNQITNRTILAFNAISDLEIYGESGTVFQLDFEQETVADLQRIREKQIALLTINASENIYVHDIELKGNFEFTGGSGDVIDFYTEHRNILVRDSKSVYLYNLKSTKSEGDAISIVASASSNGIPNNTSDIFVTNVEMNNLNRNGISIAGGGTIHNIYISKCDFGGKIRTQQLDFEPTENTSNTPNVSDIDVWDNTFNILEPSSNRGSQGAISVLTREGNGISCVLIRDNVINNDIQLLRGASHINLLANTNIPSLVIANNANAINVSENTFSLSLSDNRAIQRENSGILITNVTNDFGNFEPSEIVFLNNTIQQQISNNGLNVTKALSVKNADAVRFSSNTIALNNGAQGNIGFLLDFEFLSGFENINFTDNTNEFEDVLPENKIRLSGETEHIIINQNCN